MGITCITSQPTRREIYYLSIWNALQMHWHQHEKPVFKHRDQIIVVALGTRVCDNVLNANMKSYIPLETAAMFFSSEPLSKTGY